MRSKYLSMLLIAVVSTANATNRAATIHRQQNESASGKVIWGEELNIYGDTVYLNNSLQYYGEHWTVGVQSTNTRLAGIQAQLHENDSYINASYKTTLPYRVAIELGSQIGTTLNTNNQRLHTFSFVDVSKDWFDGKLMAHVGGYHINDALAAIHQPYNYQAGIKFKVDKFITTIDYYGGHNNWSGGNITIYYKATDYIRPYIGLQTPAIHATGEIAGVVGFTLSLTDIIK